MLPFRAKEHVYSKDTKRATRKIKGVRRITESQKQGKQNVKEKLEMLNECIGVQKNEG